jgi:hypothetical protein
MVACSAAPPETITGLDPDANLADMDNDERQEACLTLRAYLAEKSGDAYQQYLCAFLAYTGAADDSPEDFTEDCTRLYQTCISAAEAWGSATPPPQTGDCDLAGGGEACNATVEELESCIGDMTAALNAFADDVRCQEPDNLDFDQPAESPACELLREKCPGWGWR